MLRLNNLAGFGAGGSSNPKVTGAFAGSIGQTNTWTFSGISFGTAAANRYVLAVIAWGASSNITTVSIGGVSATQVLATNNSTERLQYWIAPVPTGTSGNVVTNGSGTGTMACTTYAIYGTTTPNAPTVFTGTSSISQTPNIAYGSLIIGGGFALSGATTWGGVTSDHIQTISVASLDTASKAFTSGQNSYSLTASVSGSSPVCGIAIWTP